MGGSRSILLTLTLSLFCMCVCVSVVKIQWKWLCWTLQGRRTIPHRERALKKKIKKKVPCNIGCRKCFVLLSCQTTTIPSNKPSTSSSFSLLPSLLVQTSTTNQPDQLTFFFLLFLHHFFPLIIFNPHHLLHLPSSPSTFHLSPSALSFFLFLSIPRKKKKYSLPSLSSFLPFSDSFPLS